MEASKKYTLTQDLKKYGGPSSQTTSRRWAARVLIPNGRLLLKNQAWVLQMAFMMGKGDTAIAVLRVINPLMKTIPMFKAASRTSTNSSTMQKSEGDFDRICAKLDELIAY